MVIEGWISLRPRKLQRKKEIEQTFKNCTNSAEAHLKYFSKHEKEDMAIHKCLSNKKANMDK
jgi:hypothetical protein